MKRKVVFAKNGKDSFVGVTFEKLLIFQSYKFTVKYNKMDRRNMVSAFKQFFYSAA